jgi:hypothetical protein
MFRDLVPFSASADWTSLPFAKFKYDGRIELIKDNENGPFLKGHSLYQELFFFCTVKNVGDIPGAGCIYVETVVDRNSGNAFAKVYPSKNTMNAVDILESRVIPFFKRQDAVVREIHTRNTNEYCGLLSVHPFETFLADSHIQHLPKDQPGHPDNYLCEQFYRLSLKDFFLPALRMKYELSLGDLQRDLDKFVETYNAARFDEERVLESAPRPSPNFPVDL